MISKQQFLESFNGIISGKPKPVAAVIFGGDSELRALATSYLGGSGSGVESLDELGPVPDGYITLAIMDDEHCEDAEMLRSTVNDLRKCGRRTIIGVQAGEFGEKLFGSATLDVVVVMRQIAV